MNTNSRTARTRAMNAKRTSSNGGNTMSDDDCSSPETLSTTEKSPQKVKNTFFKINFEDLQFARQDHFAQFISFAKQVRCRVTCFTVLSSVQCEELWLRCNSCYVSFVSVKEAIDHLDEKSHKKKQPKSGFSATAMSVSKRSWSFLEYSSKLGNCYCSCCKEQIQNKFSLWLQHLQNENHVLKIQETVLKEKQIENSVTSRSDQIQGSSTSIENSTNFSSQAAILKHSSNGAFQQGWNTPASNLLEFKQISHKTEYDKLCAQIPGRLQFFQIESKESKKKLQVKCILCDSMTGANNALRHLNSDQHLRNMNLQASTSNKRRNNLKRKSNKTKPLANKRKKLKGSKKSKPPTPRHRVKERRYEKVCEKIKTEIHLFEELESDRLKFKCLLCEKKVDFTKMEQHVLSAGHKRKKIKDCSEGPSWRFDQELMSY